MKIATLGNVEILRPPLYGEKFLHEVEVRLVRRSGSSRTPKESTLPKDKSLVPTV